MCRNVLIYFPFKLANEVIAAFGELAHPGTYLFVGHSEAFPALSQLDAVYSHATYYYRYHITAGEQADVYSVSPGPTLSIPGIGVKTIVPKSPVPTAAMQRAYSPQLQSKGQGPAAGGKQIALGKSDISVELENIRREINQGKVTESYERLCAIAAGSGKLDYRVHFLKAIVADQERNIHEAIEGLKKAIFLNKAFIIGHFYLGVIHQREAQLASAKRYFRNALSLLTKLPVDHLLDEAEGLTAGRLREIVEARAREIDLETAGMR